MNGRKALIVLTALCAIALNALVASGASGATSGTTTFTCKKEPVSTNNRFLDPHCLNPAVPPNEGAYTHVGWSGTTPINKTNEKTASETTAAAPTLVEGTLSGIVTAIECKTVTGSGTGEEVLSGEEHFFTVTTTNRYGSCAVTKPAGRECKVKAGEIVTEKISATSKGAGDNIEFIGAGAEKKFASITLEGCKENKPPNTSYPLSGSVRIPPNGATLSSTIAATKAQGTLIFGGNVAGIQGSTTTTNANNGTPLVVTTPPFTE